MRHSRTGAAQTNRIPRRFCDRARRTTAEGNDAAGVGPLDTAYSATKDSAFAVVLRSLLNLDPRLTRDQQVGRLLVADWLLAIASESAVYWGYDGREKTRALLTSLGVGLHEDHLDGWLYDRAWLAQALAMGGKGPAADRAFLDAMRYGFEFAGACGAGHQVDDVIRRGNAYLAGHPGSPIRGEVHLMIAEAYSDVVSLSSGAEYGGGGEDTTRYAPQRASARVHAIGHSREGFRLAGSLPRSRDDCDNVWRLIAGISPLRTTFYCVYD